MNIDLRTLEASVTNVEFQTGRTPWWALTVEITLFFGKTPIKSWTLTTQDEYSDLDKYVDSDRQADAVEDFIAEKLKGLFPED